MGVGGDTTNGNTLGIWDCNRGESQQWGFDWDAGTMYYVASSGHDASKCSSSGDSWVGIWDCNFDETQVSAAIWNYQGSSVAIWDCNFDETQVWAVNTDLAHEKVV